jgi:hypothetical protein
MYRAMRGLSFTNIPCGLSRQVRTCGVHNPSLNMAHTSSSPTKPSGGDRVHGGPQDVACQLYSPGDTWYVTDHLGLAADFRPEDTS